GTIIVAMQIASRMLAPRKRSLANAKPASVQNATVPSVIAPETIRELTRPRFRGARSSAFFTLSKTEALGSIGGGLAAISAVVWGRNQDGVVQREDRARRHDGNQGVGPPAGLVALAAGRLPGRAGRGSSTTGHAADDCAPHRAVPPPAPTASAAAPARRR